MAPAETVDLSGYKTILANNSDSFWKSKGDKRQAVLKAIIGQMEAEAEGDLMKKGLEKVGQLIQTLGPEISPIWAQKISTWYYNHKDVPLGDEPTLVPVGTVWNHRLVIQQLFKNELSKKMEGCNLAPTDPARLQQYQWKTNEVIAELGDAAEVKEKYQEIAKSWNEAGLPEELQRK